MCGRGGRGRHSFVFSRSTEQLSWLGFQIFCSVPFLYELRQILDWSCTPTTLKLFDWLKLEVSSIPPSKALDFQVSFNRDVLNSKPWI